MPLYEVMVFSVDAQIMHPVCCFSSQDDANKFAKDELTNYPNIYKMDGAQEPYVVVVKDRTRNRNDT